MSSAGQVIIFMIWVLIGIAIMGVCYVVLNSAFGQEVKTVTPTPVPTPTPTEPNPNFQYLPQKAAVTVYNPEIGIPANTQPLQVVPQVIPTQQNVTSGLIDSVGGIAGIMGILGAGVAYFKGHLANNKAKETMAAEVKTKEQVGELARVTYDMNAEKANLITDAPAVKLETLAEDKAEFSEKAAKS